MATMLRASSGLLKAHDFSTFTPGNLNGQQGWVVDTGTWTVIGGVLVRVSAGNYDRCRNNSISLTQGCIAVRARIPAPNKDDSYIGSRLKVVASTTPEFDIHTFLQNNDWQTNYVDNGIRGNISFGSGNVVANNTYYWWIYNLLQEGPSGWRQSAYQNATAILGPDHNTSQLWAVGSGGFGLIGYGPGGVEYTHVVVTRSLYITVEGLTGTQGARLYDAAGSVVASSGTQSGGSVRLNTAVAFGAAGSYTGHIQVFNDAGTWADPVSTGRYPAAGNASDLYGGDTYDLAIRSVGVQINWDGAAWPDEWTVPATKDVTADLMELDLSIVAANPRIEVDTCTITLRDPDGKYVPGRTEGALYPNVRLGRALRVVVQIGTVTACPFYGRIAEYSPRVGGMGGVDEQICEIRAESPIRTLSTIGLQVETPPSGVLVDASGTVGAVPSLLALIPTVFPANTWALEPTPDTIDPGFLTSGMTIQTALEQCAIFADSLLYVRGYYKTLTDEPNYQVVWRARDTAGTAVADHTWVDTAGDITGLSVRFTGDSL